MKRIIIQVVLAAIIVFLGYFVYQSIMEPVHFDKEKRLREKEVISKLKDIRLAQFVYKRVNGAYADNFDSLVDFLADAEIPIVKMIADPEDTTFTKTINDTVGYIKVSDSLFSRKNYKLPQLNRIPFSDGELFKMNADTIERGGVDVHVFLAEAPYTAYLKGMDNQTIINIVAKREDIDKYPGLKVGSMTEASTDGNWE